MLSSRQTPAIPIWRSQLDCRRLAVAESLLCFRSHSFVLTQAQFEQGPATFTALINATNLMEPVLGTMLTVGVEHHPQLSLLADVQTCRVEAGESEALGVLATPHAHTLTLVPALGG